LEQTPGVISVLPSSSSRYPRINASFSTVLLKGPGERGTIDEIAARLRKVLYPEFANTRPRINFPNALGGTDSYAPIRGMLMGPDLKKLAEMCQELNKEIFKVESLA